ncbi:MAG: hybrid-cluster NAD(P)-dependent oxidoreductase [Pseudomonadota bacterium]
MPRAETPSWTDAEPLECVLVIPEAPDVATFAFRAPSGAWFRYQPGQFLTLELPVPGGPIHRTFTISTSPSQALSIAVTVKAQTDSVGARWMIDHLHPGVRLRAFGPGGIFTLPQQPDGKYLFIAAGSGITPIMSMAAYLFDRGEEPDIGLINCARRPSELIFRQKLEFMASRVPGIKLHFVVGEDDRYDVWTGYRGRFNSLMLGLMAPDYLERDVYCCGPTSFMDAVRDMLNSLGYDMDRYRQETFNLQVEEAAEAPDLDDVVPSEATRAEVLFARSGIATACTETDTVLAVAKASGLHIASGCQFGICGTCKVMKRSGQVHMVHNGGISEDDIEAGYILACCSHPIGHLEVEV